MKIRNWDTFLFVVAYHVLIVALLPFFVPVFSWGAVALFAVTYCIGGLSITAGYHRLYAHRAYAANPVFEWCVLLGSTLALEMSALKWSHDHRLHHNHVDTEKDPYRIQRGFWYAHLLWLFEYRRDFNQTLVADLLKNPRVRFQDRYYPHLVIAVNLAVFAAGALWVGPFASFYMGFLVRMACIHHSTWAINSLAHTIGSKTYARELSAVDNAILALITFGEGYHNYHHAFAADYRNGIRWYHFDPTKWLIWVASCFGLARNLRVINTITIQKTLVQRDRKLIREQLNDKFDHFAAHLQNRLADISTRFEDNASELMLKFRQLKEASRDQRSRIRREIKELRRNLRSLWAQWLELTRIAAKEYDLAH